MNLFAPSRAVRKGEKSWVVKLTEVRGLGTLIIQLSNFNCLRVSLDVIPGFGTTRSDATLFFLIQRIQQGRKLLAVYVPGAQDLGGHSASSVKDRK